MASLESSVSGRAARLGCGLIVKIGFLACGTRSCMTTLPRRLPMAYYCCTLLLHTVHTAFVGSGWHSLHICL